MSSQFKANKNDRLPHEILADISADSKIHPIEWHLAERIYNYINENDIVALHI